MFRPAQNRLHRSTSLRLSSRTVAVVCCALRHLCAGIDALTGRQNRPLSGQRSRDCVADGRFAFVMQVRPLVVGPAALGSDPLGDSVSDGAESRLAAS